MGIEIAINAAREETRVAVLENRVLTQLFIDRKKDQGIVGNVYKGRVVKVLPGMQAAFVDIGVERAAFLYVADIATANDSYAPMLDEIEESQSDSSPEADGGEDDLGPVGSGLASEEAEGTARCCGRRDYPAGLPRSETPDLNHGLPEKAAEAESTYVGPSFSSGVER